LSSGSRKSSPAIRPGLVLGALVAALVCAVAVVVAIVPSAAHAQAQTLLTSDANVASVACPAIGSCTAVGSYQAVGGEPLGLLLTQTEGVWSGSAKATLPAGANSDPNVNLASVACASAGYCTAVGNYVDNGYFQQGVMINERKGGWRAGIRALAPAGAAANPQVTLDSVSCAAAGYCTAVGSYVTPAGDSAALLLNENDWNWSAGQSVPLPPGVPSSSSSSLAAVSCTDVGDCTAVGWYIDANGAIQGLLLTETSGQLSAAVEAALPTAAAGQPNVMLSSVACSAPGTCAAVGEYDDSASNQQGLLLSQNDGSWSLAVQPQLPGNALITQATTLNSVTCTGAGDCTAVGEYTDSHESFQGLLLTESNGTWDAGVEAVLPANAAGNQNVALDSVSCVAYETCVVAGMYFGAHPTGLLLSETGGRWELPLSAYMPSGASGNPYANLDAVACAAGAYCVAAGTYVDSSGNSQGALFDGNGLLWKRGLEAPLPGGLVTALRRRAPVHKREHKSSS
jgi:hypothetical protein